MDKVDEQLGARGSSRRWMDNAGMVTRLGFLRLGLEWPGCGAAWQLATDSNCRVHRRRRLIVHGRVCQCNLSYNSAPLDS